MSEGEGVKMVKGEGEKGGRAKEGGEAAVMVEGKREDGAGEICKLGRSKGGECCRDDSFFFHHGIVCLESVERLKNVWLFMRA